MVLDPAEAWLPLLGEPCLASLRRAGVAVVCIGHCPAATARFVARDGHLRRLEPARPPGR